MYVYYKYVSSAYVIIVLQQECIIKSTSSACIIFVQNIARVIIKVAINACVIIDYYIVYTVSLFVCKYCQINMLCM